MPMFEFSESPNSYSHNFLSGFLGRDRCFAVFEDAINDSFRALALKALILERMGKNEEALSVCLNAKEILCSDNSNVYVDDLTLSTLQIVFQRLDHYSY
ncbi:hypothetical protein ACS0TY_006110 [Phlomoides rotata]